MIKRNFFKTLVQEKDLNAKISNKEISLRKKNFNDILYNKRLKYLQIKNSNNNEFLIKLEDLNIPEELKDIHYEALENMSLEENLIFPFQNFSNESSDIRKFSILLIRKLLENKKDSSKNLITKLFNYPILDQIITNIQKTTDYVELNELFEIVINLTFINDKFINYFLKDNILCERLFEILKTITNKKDSFSICRNILYILGNLLSNGEKFNCVLQIIPFQDLLYELLKKMNSLSNEVLSILIWAFGKAVKQLPKIFCNYLSTEIIQDIVKKSQFFVDEELCFEAINFLKIISQLKNKNLNQYLMEFNILGILINHIKKNYDFELTTNCYIILQNLGYMEENAELMLKLYKEEIFLFSTNRILFDIRTNFDNYKHCNIELFFKTLIKIFKVYFTEDIVLIKKLNKYTIDFSLIMLIKNSNDESLIYNFLRYVRRKLGRKSPQIIFGLTSIGFVQFLLEIVFIKFSDDIDIMECSLKILEEFLIYTKDKKNDFVKIAILKSNAYNNIDKLRSNSNDNIATLSNDLIENYFI